MAITKLLHIRRLAEFERGFKGWLAEQVREANNLFSSVTDIELAIGSNELTLFAEGIVNVDSCLMGIGNTAEQLALFNNVPDIPATSTNIVVFVVRDFSPWKGGGCAWHPPTRLGCMVTVGTKGAAEWKLAHELGHVFGLFHNDLTTMLMYPSVFWSQKPPFLSADEIAFLQGGPAPIPSPDGSVGLSEESFDMELRRIEPNYRKLSKHGERAVPILRRIYERTLESEYKARSVYALSLVTPSFDDVLVSAANSPAPEERRAAADAAGTLFAQPIGKRVLSQLLNDPDPSVRYLAKKYTRNTRS